MLAFNIGMDVGTGTGMGTGTGTGARITGAFGTDIGSRTDTERQTRIAQGHLPRPDGFARRGLHDRSFVRASTEAFLCSAIPSARRSIRT